MKKLALVFAAVLCACTDRPIPYPIPSSGSGEIDVGDQCVADVDCPGDEFGHSCSFGYCVPPSCSEAIECEAPGWTCIQGFCALPCTSDADCEIRSSTWECLNSACVYLD